MRSTGGAIFWELQAVVRKQASAAQLQSGVLKALSPLMVI
jgi:hypothetical protein